MNENLLLLGSKLSIPLSVDLTGERLLELQSNRVHERHEGSDEKTSGLGVPQRRGQETQGGSVVHGVVGNVKGESSNSLAHEDAEVVSKVGSSNTEGVHGSEHQHVAGNKEQDSKGLHNVNIGDRKKDGSGLLRQGLMVEVVSEDTEGEDGDSQQVTSSFGTSGNLSQKVSVVLGTSNNVPENGVKRDGRKADWVS